MDYWTLMNVYIALDGELDVLLFLTGQYNVMVATLWISTLLTAVQFFSKGGLHGYSGCYCDVTLICFHSRQ
jgi:hypothetical protein